MSVLNFKLRRDLWRIKGQGIAIGLVIAMGVLMQVMMTGLVASLDETRTAYYDRYRLADVFAPVTRAPNRVAHDLKQIPGVAAVETRVVGSVLIDLDGLELPIRGQAVSLPVLGLPDLNDIHLTAGRRPDGGYGQEVLVLDGFAREHGLQVGDSLQVTMNGFRRLFSIVGFAQAPEFLYTAAPGEFAPDDSRFAVLWIGRPTMAAAFDMEGAFNEALLSLERGATGAAVLDAVDRRLDRYGSQGAFALKDLFSNRFVTEEIAGLGVTSRIVPPIFMAVAAFLLYIVISRMVQSEREEIGLLKAFGYSDWEVSAHYFKLILTIAAGGAIAGCLMGVAAGRAMIDVYLNFFKFPFLVFRLDPVAFAIGFLASILAASAGGLVVLRRVFALTPAAAMRPAAPPDYSRTGRFGGLFGRFLDQPSRMVLRRIIRQPWRMAGAVAGISAGVALSAAMASVLANFDDMMELSFGVVDRSDLMVSFSHPLSVNVAFDLERVPGVIEVEPVRMVPAVLYNGANSYRGTIDGLPEASRLYRAVDDLEQAIFMRDDGIILSTGLASVLGIQAGQIVTVDVREGPGPRVDIPVIAIAESLLGAPAYMELSALNRVLREPMRISAAYLRVDSDRSTEVYEVLKEMPMVVGVSLKGDSRNAFQRLMDEGAGMMRYVMAAIAAVITFGVVYNAARVAQAERSRDLASLRVLGFSRGETAFVLLGELAAVVLLALPIGSMAGYFLTFAISWGFSTDIYQIRAAFHPSSYGLSAAIVLLAAIMSGWLVKRDIDRADMVTALKTRE